MTLSEELRFEDGRLTNPGLAFYKVPIFPDLPDEIEVEFVESPHPKGPFGAKGVGETGTLAVAAAVGNALFDAVGVRVRELPLTPERVLRALKAAAGSALG
jgi:CO/xanthine dehydrogenase Mo-binding subunit